MKIEETHRAIFTQVTEKLDKDFLKYFSRVQKIALSP